MNRDKQYIKANLKMRKKEFAITITNDDSIIPNERMVHITHNGHDWQGGLYLIPNEARKLIIELEKFASPATNLKYNNINLDIFSCDICGFPLSEHINQEGCIF